MFVNRFCISSKLVIVRRYVFTLNFLPAFDLVVETQDTLELVRVEVYLLKRATTFLDCAVQACLE
jgi:hypothetical protein